MCSAFCLTLLLKMFVNHKRYLNAPNKFCFSSELVGGGTENKKPRAFGLGLVYLPFCIDPGENNLKRLACVLFLTKLFVLRPPNRLAQ